MFFHTIDKSLQEDEYHFQGQEVQWKQ